MKIEEAAEIILAQRRRGKRSPDALRGKISIDEAYRVQQAVAESLQAQGARQVGWKIGGNSNRFRNTYEQAAPLRGYLFKDAEFHSGQRIDYGALTVLPRMESELCFTMKARLAGAVTRDEVLAAVESVAPAFEIPCVIESEQVDLVAAGRLDLPMCIADNANTFLHVIGEQVRPYPLELDLAEMQVEERCNERLSQQGRAGNHIDDQLDSIVWLAGNLAEYGLSIEPGQYILSGNCCGAAIKAEQGDRWETTFAHVGRVSITFG